MVAEYTRIAERAYNLTMQIRDARLPGANLSKEWCRLEELIAFLHCGADIVSVNREVQGPSYEHVVTYRGITFGTASGKPIPAEHIPNCVPSPATAPMDMRHGMKMK